METYYGRQVVIGWMLLGGLLSDFGSVNLTGATLVRTFTIANSGAADLMAGAGAITLRCANAEDFTVGGITLPATIADSGRTTFTVSFVTGAVLT